MKPSDRRNEVEEKISALRKELVEINIASPILVKAVLLTPAEVGNPNMNSYDEGDCTFYRLMFEMSNRERLFVEFDKKSTNSDLIESLLLMIKTLKGEKNA